MFTAACEILEGRSAARLRSKKLHSQNKFRPKVAIKATRRDATKDNKIAVEVFCGFL